MLEVRGLTVGYAAAGRQVRAVEDVTFAIGSGECLGLIGESGCGKTTLALAILDLLPSGGKRITGQVILSGTSLTNLPPSEMRRKRWTEIAYVPQGAINALDPVSTLFRQFEVTAKAHGGIRDLRKRAGELFHQVELDAIWLDRYPHQLSGGMRQRAAIALALLFAPQFLIADEPTTGLDVLVQREVLNVLQRVQRERGMTLLVVSHDLGVIGELCQRVAVMYAGRIVEEGALEPVLGRPAHPYSMGLRLAFGDIARPDRPPISIPGAPPAIGAALESCGFADRCPFTLDVCRTRLPAVESAVDRKVACHRHQEADALRRASLDPNVWDHAEAMP